MAWSSVARCRGVFLAADVSVRHFSTSADLSGQFGTGAEVSYGHFGIRAEMSWSEVSWHHLFCRTSAIAEMWQKSTVLDILCAKVAVYY